MHSGKVWAGTLPCPVAAAQQLQESLLPALEWGAEEWFLALAELKHAGFKKLLRSLSKPSAISLWSANRVKVVLGHSLCRESCTFYDGQLLKLFPLSFSMLCLWFLSGFVVRSFLACQFLFLPEAGAAPACQQQSDGCALFINPLLRPAFGKPNEFCFKISLVSPWNFPHCLGTFCLFLQSDDSNIEVGL